MSCNRLRCPCRAPHTPDGLSRRPYTNNPIECRLQTAQSPDRFHSTLCSTAQRQCDTCVSSSTVGPQSFSCRLLRHLSVSTSCLFAASVFVVKGMLLILFICFKRASAQYNRELVRMIFGLSWRKY
jgi:hypothetical protein